MARITLSTHWKFQRLARALGSKVLARGILETIWEPCWMVGDAYCGTSSDIEALCEWRGEQGALTKALLMPEAKNAGFIEPYKGNVRGQGEAHYQVHDFFHHCPEYVRRRADRERALNEVRECVLCKQEYPARNPTSKYCSSKCRQKAYREANGEPEPVTAEGDSVTDRDSGVTAGVTDAVTNHRNNTVTKTSDLLRPGCNTTVEPYQDDRENQADSDEISSGVTAALRSETDRYSTLLYWLLGMVTGYG